MATATIKSTYALDVETVRALEHMAKRWKVSKSEALRRAIGAAAMETPPEASEAVAALNELQRSVRLTPTKAAAWLRANEAERRASSRQREPVGR